MAAKGKKPKKREPSAAPRKKKSKLPDLVSGKFCITVQTMENHVKGILQSDGTSWADLPASPYIFPSKTHAQAYIDGMAGHIKPNGSKIVPVKLSDFYGQHFKIVDGEPGQPEKIVTTLVKKDDAVNFRQAVKARFEERYKSVYKQQDESIKAEIESHKRELAERERAYRERLKAKKIGLSATEKAMKAFMSQMKKLGG